MAKKSQKVAKIKVRGNIRTLLDLLDFFGGPDSFTEGDVKEWLVDGINNMLKLTPKTDMEFDDDALKAVLALVKSDAWPLAWALIENILKGKYILKEDGEKDETGRSLLVGKRRDKEYTERRFGLRSEKIKEALADLIETHGPEFKELSVADQSQMVIDSIAGGRKGRQMWARRVGEGRDWESFFAAIAKFLELIIPLFLMFM